MVREHATVTVASIDQCCCMFVKLKHVGYTVELYLLRIATYVELVPCHLDIVHASRSSVVAATHFNQSINLFAIKGHRPLTYHTNSIQIYI